MDDFLIALSGFDDENGLVHALPKATHIMFYYQFACQLGLNLFIFSKLQIFSLSMLLYFIFYRKLQLIALQ
jgi:hypothetical protein